VIEAQNEARTILDAVEKGEKTAAWEQLSADEHRDIRAAVEALKAVILGSDYKLIRSGIEDLDKKTRRFAEIMMDSAVTGALGGKTMQSASEGLGAGPTAPHPFAKADVEETKPETPPKDKMDDDEGKK
jgi:molecular chaperone DnaK/molecular chaperone HscA